MKHVDYNVNENGLIEVYGVFKFFDRYLAKFETTKKLTFSFVGCAIKNMERL